jgi:hypothetical protein
MEENRKLSYARDFKGKLQGKSIQSDLFILFPSHRIEATM